MKYIHVCNKAHFVHADPRTKLQNFFSIQSFLKVFATWHINFTKFFYLCYRDFKIKTSPILEKFDPTRETGDFICLFSKFLLS